ncbi:neutral zinc metallopeptidase [Aquihabitans daechungensis]|uniref:neutral zinc metallopeptidase n=1 Tax=Aquihabitans daechungensis TaxID=1052257 RepID=UPI003BA06051
MSASNRSKLGRRRALVLAILVSLSACGVEAGQQDAATTRSNDGIVGSDVEDTSTTAPTTTAPPPPTEVDIAGSDGSELNDVIGNAIADLEEFWSEAYPDAFGADYEPLSGGLFAIDRSTDALDIPCATGPDITELLQNAYYCPPADAVVWDQEAFMPDLAERYGSFTVAVVIAHEWGHVIQERTRFSEASVTTELQADCFAGSWVKHVEAGDSPRFDVTTDDLDQSLAGVLSLRDAPGGFADDPQAHGSGFDRVGAFQDGFEHGVERCAEFTDGDPAPYEFPFSDQAEAESGGDLHLSGSTSDPGIIDLAFPSLDAFWTDTFPTVSDDGDDWDPLSDPVAFSSDDPPTCGGDPIDGYLLFVCIPDRYVGFEDSDTIPAVYEQSGDFAVATLFATQYGLDAVEQLGTADDEVSATLQGDCFAGAWAAALLPPDPPEDYQLVLSPGDLDEGVAVLLSFRSEGDRERQGPGFDRVRAYRLGVLRGAEACTDID